MTTEQILLLSTLAINAAGIIIANKLTLYRIEQPAQKAGIYLEKLKKGEI